MRKQIMKRRVTQQADHYCSYGLIRIRAVNKHNLIAELNLPTFFVI